MDPETPEAPPEALLIRTAREAAGMTAAQAAAATEGAVSATYWRDVERGYGGRRGQRAPARASARLLAAMARITGVTPDELAGARREDAARVLAEILRRQDAAPPPGTPSLRPLPPAPAARPGSGAEPPRPGSEAEEVLARLLTEHSGDEVIQAMGAPSGPQALKPAYEVAGEVLRWLERQGNGAAAEAERARLVGRYPDDEVLQVINRQTAKKSWMVTVEMLEWLAVQGPAVPQARNGTAG